MQALPYYPPTVEKTPLSEHELEKISTELKRLTEGAAVKCFLGLGLAILITSAPIQEPDNESLIGQFGLSNGLLLTVAFLSIPILWAYFSTRKKLKKDLQERAKTIRQSAIIRKERSFLKKKIYAQIVDQEPDYQEFEVDDSLFAKLEQGQQVRLEYASNSKCLLHIGW
jgi:hypothetical protein